MADLRVDYRREPFVDDAEVLSRRLSSSLGRSSPKSPTEALQPEAVPPPPLRSRAVRHPLVVFLNFVLTVAIIAVVAAVGGVFAAKMQFNKPGVLDQPRTINVPAGSSLSAIADELQKEGAISSKWLFIAGVWLNHQQGAMKFGEYQIDAHASMHDIMDAIASGRGILYSIVIPEGLTSQQVVDRLNGDDRLTGEIAAVPPEGSLLPETYKVTRGETRQSVLDHMAQERNRVVAEVWQQRAPDLPITTPDQMVTLASIVEKETGIADERSRVAAVFINRLRLNMRLQSDPTVIYGLFQGAGKPQGYTLAKADIEKASAYNTYMITGLPPGPIANPGRASLEAVANPSRTRDLYFVADGTGGHAFAETYEQHLKNVARWRDISANAGAALAGGASAPPADAGSAPPATDASGTAAPTGDVSTPAPDATSTNSGGSDMPLPTVRPAIANPPAPAPKMKPVTLPSNDAPMSLDPNDPDAPDPEGAAGQ
ncbi:MAG TPA: endolytic transglycosylase MltG [Bauldia sp.]|nr:endolytic transglycosylase MltG [Bauldia sp.]